MSCSSFLQLLKSKQYCGICKKIWHHSDGGDWVRYLTFDIVDFRSLKIIGYLNVVSCCVELFFRYVVMVAMFGCMLSVPISPADFLR